MMSLTELMRIVAAMGVRAGNPNPAYQFVGILMSTSADKNFEAGGRPSAWAPLSEATKKRKKSSRILVDTGHLRQSLVPHTGVQVEGNSVKLGTNLPYGRIHQFGGTIQVGAHQGAAFFKVHKKTGAVQFTSFKKYEKHHALGPMARHKARFTFEQRFFQIGTHAITIPARPYLMFQAGEPEKYGEIIKRYVIQGDIKEK